jgi:hypothetical protein
LQPARERVARFGYYPHRINPMNPGHFVKVFDVLDSGYRDWTFPAFGLLFLVIGIGIVAFPKILKATGVPYMSTFRPRTFMGYAFIVFSLLWTGMTFYGTYSQHLRHRTLAQNNGCRVVEGPVEYFIPMPYEGHSEESFFVSGMPFHYSDFNITDGFNNTSSHGGPINASSYVRICYDPAGNVILRLEIRDFKGTLKDYSKPDNIFFPGSHDVPGGVRKNPATGAWWESYAFIAAYLLDALAIWALFLPYLRTFIRIKTIPLRDCVLTSTLPAGRKIKLRNSMMYWDRDEGTIWLRPRGFNSFKIHQMVAKLNVDADGKTISEEEIRLSSGFPFVTALFLWAAYRLFTTVDPPLPTPFIAIVPVFVVIAGFINLRVFRSRMETVAQDALAELREVAQAQR